MRITVNGDAREFPDGSTVADLLEALGTAREGVAVALDGQVVRRAEWARVVVPDGARLEILTAVQGG
ncbi:sulfur carrier protein ThiS [Prauserella oleivorans]|uniref:Sulfur carrier protein ThiS n=1 Tax=Prauserella oleivorans TaxID=1478153 RepID=A0ABW5W942_9PSEU